MEWIQTIDARHQRRLLPFLPDDIKRQVAVGVPHSLKLLGRVACRRRVLASEGGGSGMLSPCCQTGSQFPLAGRARRPDWVCWAPLSVVRSRNEQ